MLSYQVSLVSLTVIIGVILSTLTTGTNGLAGVGHCKMETAEEGARFCRKAFQTTYEHNKYKIFLHPKKIGCCMSFNMGDCVKYAFVKAKCSPDDHLRIASLVSDRVKEAQDEFNKGTDYVSSLICGDQTLAQCTHLIEEYNKAKVEIDVLNAGYSPLVTPFLAIACSLIALYFS